MPVVDYQLQLEYAYDRSGRRFPQLAFRVSSPRHSTPAVDLQAFLDSGAERSLFNGRIGTALGIDILTGPKIRYESAAGSYLSVTMHPLRLVHDDLGVFDLQVGFSSTELRRNLLGRDFFDLVQVGFRERHLSFYVTPRP